MNMNSNLWISWNVVISIPREDEMRKLGKDDMIFVLPIDPAKYNSKNENTLDYRFRREFTGNKEIKYEKKVIRNSGFSLELYQTDERRVMYVKNYIPLFLVRLHHPDLDTLPVPVVTYIQTTTLLALIKEVGWVSEGRIHGSFCCSHLPSFSGLWCSLFVPDDPSRSELTEEKEVGRLLETGKRTQKWKPGSLYVLPSRHTVLYLGTLSGRLGIRDYTNNKEPGIPLTFDLNSYYLELSPLQTTWHLFLNITGEGKTKKEWIKGMKGKKVTEFIQSYLLSFPGDYLNLRFYSGDIKRSATIRELDYLSDDSTPGLDTIVTGYFSGNLNCELYTGASIYKTLTPRSKDWADSWVKSCIRDWLTVRGRYSYYGSEPKITTSDQLIRTIETSNSRYSVGKLKNLMIWMGKTDFERVAKEQLGS